MGSKTERKASEVAKPRTNDEHPVVREGSSAHGMHASSDGRGLIEKATALVQNSHQDKPRPTGDVTGRSESGPDGHNATFADMTFWDGSMASVLLIEDDKETAQEIRAELADRGYVVDWAADGIEGLDKARSGGADAMIVDRLLPGMDGLTIVQAMRDEGVRTPVLVLSALGAVDDRVRGLRAGGDDYLTKPFATVELIARI